MPAHRVLLITSVHPAWANVREALQALPGVHIVGRTQSLDAAAEAVATHQPALVLASGRALVEQDPLQLLGQLRSTSPNTKILVVLDHVRAREVLDRTELPPNGFLHFGDLIAPGLEFCLDAVLNRDLWIGNDAAVRRLFEELREAHEPAAVTVDLKPDEQAVLQLLAQGHTHAQIVTSLHFSAATVTRRIDDLQDRLGVDNTASLLVKAARLGLVA